MPSNRMVSICRAWPSELKITKARGDPPSPRARAPYLLLDFGRVLDGVEGRELDVIQLAALPLDLANVDVLHDVARLRIDRDRPARTFPAQTLHGRDQAVAIRLAAGLLQGFVDQVHAVVAAHRHEVGAEARGLLEGLHVGLVLGRVV